MRGVGDERLAARRRSVVRARRRRAAALVGAVVAVLAAVWVIWFSSWLTVSAVEVEGVSGNEQRAVARVVEAQLGRPLARVDLEEVARQVMTQRRPIAQARVERGWPRTLVVSVLPRTPALVLKNPQGQLEVVDATGVRYATVSARPSGVPLATAEGSAALSPEAMKAALGVLRVLPESLSRTVSDIRVSSASLVTFRTGTTTVRWGGAGDEELKLRIVQTLLARSPKEIDVSAPQTPVTR